MTKLEIELVKAKQQLGDALNVIHELETQDMIEHKTKIKQISYARQSNNFSDERMSEESRSQDSDEEE